MRKSLKKKSECRRVETKMFENALFETFPTHLKKFFFCIEIYFSLLMKKEACYACHNIYIFFVIMV